MIHSIIVRALDGTGYAEHILAFSIFVQWQRHTHLHSIIDICWTFGIGIEINHTIFFVVLPFPSVCDVRWFCCFFQFHVFLAFFPKISTFSHFNPFRLPSVALTIFRYILHFYTSDEFSMSFLYTSLFLSHALPNFPTIFVHWLLACNEFVLFMYN